jgi:hypothetical protein
MTTFSGERVWTRREERGGDMETEKLKNGGHVEVIHRVCSGLWWVVASVHAHDTCCCSRAASQCLGRVLQVHHKDIAKKTRES